MTSKPRHRIKANTRRVRDQTTSQINPFAFGSNNSFGSVSAGGFMNPMTGAGIPGVDKSQSGFFSPTWVTNRTELETLYTESWAAEHFIDMPVDDMFIRYREFDDMDEKIIDDLEAQEKQHMIKPKLGNAMKAGRLFGTGLMCIITSEMDIAEPLDIRRIKKGDLKNIIVADRYSAVVTERDDDFMSPTYNQPLKYRIDLKRGRSFEIHATRVIRFEGRRPLASDGWYNYFDDWGVSEIVPVITSIYQDASLAQGIAHLAQEASIPVQKIHDFQDALEGGDGDMSLAQRGAAISMARSIYRTIYMDANDEFERQDVTFSGLPDLMDRYQSRMASAAAIPMTRFLGTSPIGLNATGEGDMVNYAISVNAMQAKMLTMPLELLDQILLRSAGYATEIEVDYKWSSLIDQSDEDQANVAFKKMEIAEKGINNGILDEDEARAILDGDSVIGTLKDQPDLMEEEDFDGAATSGNTSPAQGRTGVSRQSSQIAAKPTTANDDKELRGRGGISVSFN